MYVKKNDVSGELRNAFNTNKEGEVYVCFENILDNGIIVNITATHSE